MEPTTPDRGTTLVEVVSALVLVSLTVGGLLTLLGQNVAASVRHREGTAATTWLQSASEHLQLVPLEFCGTPTSVMAAYQDTVRSEVPTPTGWSSTDIEVVDVRFWADDSFGPACSDRAQLVTLAVTTPRGVHRTLEVVVGNVLDGTDGAVDPSSVCTFVRATFRDKKSGLVQVSPLVALPLKKPSTTRPSELKSRYLTVVVETSGVCSGELRLRYKYPHRNHFHWKTVKLRQVKGQSNVAAGKFGSRREKYLANAVLDMRLEQGRSRRRAFGVVASGDLRGLVVMR